MSTVRVDIHKLTRVEGHGDIGVLVEDGKLKEASWEIVETPRYFEVMLKGKHYTSAAVLTSRICGICSIGHTLASLRATEHALGVEIPRVARKLRLLAKHGETLQSHYLHLFFLAVPDFLGAPSAIALIEADPELVGVAARLKRLGNTISEVAAGRMTHPVSLLVGGVAKMPERTRLAEIKAELEASLELVKKVIETFATLEIPEFARETEFVSLGGTEDYPWIGGRIVSTDGVDLAEADYLQATNEYCTDGNTSKWTKLSRESYAVGALARLNNNFDKLTERARQVARDLGLTPVNHNPFMNNIAQLVECVHVTEDAIRLVEELLDEPKGIETMAPVEASAGRGVGAAEVPRGILFHDYEYDESGRIVRANCIIPTTQNNANIHHDLGALVEEYVKRGANDEQMELLCSMLVRAYDPCISCSVH